MNEPIQYSALNVLVVDDQAFVRRIVCTLLKQIGIANVYEASDGSAALQLVRNFVPDLIICDIEMSPMDGLSFFRMLRDRFAEMTPRTIFLTGHGESDLVAQARDLGANAFLLKPVNADQLKRRIDFVMQ